MENNEEVKVDAPVEEVTETPVEAPVGEATVVPEEAPEVFPTDTGEVDKSNA